MDLISQSLTLKTKIMKEKEIYVGIDVSKVSLDVCVVINEKLENYKIKNQVKSIQTFFSRIQKLNKGSKVCVCLESTGYYNWPCYESFKGMELELFVVNPLHLKRSLGLVRGKSDPIDARRIARYIAVNKSYLKPFIIPRKQIRILQALNAQRNRLIQARSKFSVPTGELDFIADKALTKKVMVTSDKLIKSIDAQIKVVEQELENLISGDSQLKEKFDFITSVQGVGKVLAWAMLVKTNEFLSINDPRKLACYAGVVPFAIQSGTSINKKPRVSIMADKTLKKLLHMAAMRVIQLKGDLQTYYQRKVQEGKNKMLVLNAVRNKLVARICATVNHRKKYETNLHLS
jgi:transposase